MALEGRRMFCNFRKKGCNIKKEGDALPRIFANVIKYATRKARRLKFVAGMRKGSEKRKRACKTFLKVLSLWVSNEMTCDVRIWTVPRQLLRIFSYIKAQTKTFLSAIIFTFWFAVLGIWGIPCQKCCHDIFFFDGQYTY